MRFNSTTKEKFYILALLILIVFAIIFYMNENVNADNVDIQIKQQEEKLKQIEQRKKSIQQELEKLKQEETDYQQSLKKIEGLLTEAETELKEAQKNYNNTLKQIDKIEEDLQIEQNKLDLQLIILQDRLKKFYKYNNMTYLSVLLESKDFSQFLNRCRYLECILVNDSEIVKLVSEQVQYIKKQRDSLQNKKEITKLLQEEIKKEKENIAISAKAKNQYIARIEEERKNQLAILEELEKSSTQIMEIIEIAYKEREKARLAEKQEKAKKSGVTTVRKEPTLQAKKGIFQLPLNGSIISNYGQQKQQELNAYVFNSGIDISSPLGEGVRAASFGTVIYIGKVKGYGEIIIIDHGGNVVTLYAHLSEVLVKLNKQVKKGQIIAQVGTSGGVSSPRLHFEVRVEGKPVNPFEWL